jgi:hypothetical protein
MGTVRFAYVLVAVWVRHVCGCLLRVMLATVAWAVFANASTHSWCYRFDSTSVLVCMFLFCECVVRWRVPMPVGMLLDIYFPSQVYRDIFSDPWSLCQGLINMVALGFKLESQFCLWTGKLFIWNGGWYSHALSLYRKIANLNRWCLFFHFGRRNGCSIKFVFLASNVTNLQFQVHHNMAITKSFLDGCPDPERLLKILGDVKVSESALRTVHHLLTCWLCSKVTEMDYFLWVNNFLIQMKIFFPWIILFSCVASDKILSSIDSGFCCLSLYYVSYSCMFL